MKLFLRTAAAIMLIFTACFYSRAAIEPVVVTKTAKSNPTLYFAE